MKCNEDTVKRVDDARKMLVGLGFISRRENTKVEQRVKRWIRDSGQKPAEMKEKSDGQG